MIFLRISANSQCGVESNNLIMSGRHPILPLHWLLWWKYQEEGSCLYTILIILCRIIQLKTLNCICFNVHHYLQHRKLVYKMPKDEKEAEVLSYLCTELSWNYILNLGKTVVDVSKTLMQGKTYRDLQFKFRYCGDNDEACLEIRHHDGGKVNTSSRWGGLCQFKCI